MRSNGVLLAVALVLVSFGVFSCSNEESTLRAQLQAQSTKIANLEAAIPAIAPSGVDGAASPPTPTINPSPTPTVVSTSTPIPMPTATAITYDYSEAGAIRYVANTGGVGIRLRSSCSDDASGDGGLAEGARVKVEYQSEQCPSWYMVSGEGFSSWIRSDYLSASPPVAPTPKPAPVPTTPPTSATVSNPTSSNQQSLYVEVQSIASPVGRGQSAVLIVKTLPGATCSALHPIPYETATGQRTYLLGIKTAGADGLVAFGWTTSTEYYAGYQPGGVAQQLSLRAGVSYDAERYRLYPSGSYPVYVIAQLGGQEAATTAYYMLQ